MFVISVSLLKNVDVVLLLNEISRMKIVINLYCIYMVIDGIFIVFRCVIGFGYNVFGVFWMMVFNGE